MDRQLQRIVDAGLAGLVPAKSVGFKSAIFNAIRLCDWADRNLGSLFRRAPYLRPVMKHDWKHES